MSEKINEHTFRCGTVGQSVKSNTISKHPQSLSIRVTKAPQQYVSLIK